MNVRNQVWLVTGRYAQDKVYGSISLYAIHCKHRVGRDVLYRRVWTSLRLAVQHSVESRKPDGDAWRRP